MPTFYEDPRLKPYDPEEEIRQRLRSQMIGSVNPQPSVTDQVFASLNRAKDDLALRIQGLTNPQFTPPPMPAAEPVERPSFGQRVRNVIGSPRFADAVEGFSNVISPNAGGVEGFLGSAAQAFAGARRSSREREMQDRAMAQRDAAVQSRTTPSSDHPQTIQTPRGPIELRPDGSWSFIAPQGAPLVPEKAPVAPKPERPRNIDPLSPEGIEAAKKRAEAVQSATQTPAQAQSSSFGDRAKAGSDLLNSTPTPSIADFEAGRRLSPSLRSNAYRLWRQAAEQFITAVLRKESGAAISDGEFARYQDIYIPTPGDSPELLARKKAAREREVNNLYRSGRTTEQSSVTPSEIP